jgi:hypothetical protein
MLEFGVFCPVMMVQVEDSIDDCFEFRVVELAGRLPELLVVIGKGWLMQLLGRLEILLDLGCDKLLYDGLEAV